MRRGIVCLGMAAVAAAAYSPVAAATPTEIEFGGVSFNPAEVTVDFVPGENTFEWNRNDPEPAFHSITAKGGSFGSGAPSGIQEFDLRVSAGTYPYYCINHGGGGSGPMAGVVAVRPILGLSDDDSHEVIWSDSGTQTGSTFEVRWKREGQRRWKRWGSFDASSRVFGKKDNPTEVKPAATYLIQARSMFPGASKWSPKLTIAPDA